MSLTNALGIELAKRRTFAIISHPDAGKTTMTEKLLLLAGAIQLAGSVKSRKSDRYATSDWMAMEKERGISVTTSVMQFSYRDKLFNLLDTPGHADFSEDTYRTLTAVDSALMVIDAAKGVETRTVKLLEICRLKNTPITTFINKMDRDSLSPLALLDHIDSELKIHCVPMTWPIGSGRGFMGVYHLVEDVFYLFDDEDRKSHTQYTGLHHDELANRVGEKEAAAFRDEIDLIKDSCGELDQSLYLAGEMTPVFFGSAMMTFGIDHMLNTLIDLAPSPQERHANTRKVQANESKFSGFVFKIQANMDPKHRDRIAFFRICSGRYFAGIKAYHVRMQRDFPINQAHTFVAGQREHAEEAWAGDIIGIHNHGTLKIGDTLTEGESLQFSGIPNFAPELFRRVVLKDPLKSKALLKGLMQLSEEGATQVFRPLLGSDLIVGAIGLLQFDVVAYRLQHEYRVACVYDAVGVNTAVWVSAKDDVKLKEFKHKNELYLAIDSGGRLAYLAPSRVNLRLVQERWPDIMFHDTCEH